MPYADLREFLQQMEKEGQLTRIKRQVDLKHELGAVCRRALDVHGLADNKILMFCDPGGYPIPVVVNLLATRRRYALALDTEVEKIHEKFINAADSPIPPRLVKDGPCKENILTGDEVDLYKLPIPIWNELDPAPFITAPSHISKDPETGARNVGMYRGMLHDRNNIGIMAGPYRHLIISCRKAHAKNQPFPVAVCLGTDPYVYIATHAPLPLGEDELTLAGALKGEPIELVKCETIDAEVPANCEIVLEGEIHPGELRDEGPFGEFTGYYGGTQAPRPVIRIKAITHRNDPLYLAAYQGRPPKESSITSIIPDEVEVMRGVHLPGLKCIHMTEGGINFVAIASIRKLYEGFSKVMALAILSTEPGRMIKTLILVDEDIDPFKRNLVDWALATRFLPARDTILLEGLPGVPLDPSMPKEEKLKNTNLTSKLILDATQPLTPDFPIECKPSDEVMEQVINKWPEYGID